MFALRIFVLNEGVYKQLLKDITQVCGEYKDVTRGAGGVVALGTEVQEPPKWIGCLAASMKSSNLFPSTFTIQNRQYLPKKLREDLSNRLDRLRKPFIPTETGDNEYIQEWQEDPYKVKVYKRKAWAKFGAASGVDPTSLLPTEKEIEQELEAEKQWWPTLQNMQENIAEKKKLEEMKKMEYDRKIAANMNKMPQWIKEWEENQKNDKERAESMSKERRRIVEMAREHYGYDIPAQDSRIRSFISEYTEKQREQKKLAKKVAKKWNDSNK